MTNDRNIHHEFDAHDCDAHECAISRDRRGCVFRPMLTSESGRN